MKNTLQPQDLFLRRLFFGLCMVVFSFTSNAQVSTITPWKDNVIGAIWNKKTSTVAYGKPDAQGNYKIYLSDSLGNNERPLTYAGWRSDRHQWAEEWHPSGKYLFCYVEKADYAKESHKRIPADAIPGYGGYTDLWLLTADGKQAWQLTDLPNSYDHGLLHGAISNDGTLFAWTERISAPSSNLFDFNLITGGNVFKIANFNDGETPSLSNVRTFQPGGVLAGGELESISADNSTLAFYSTFESKSIIATPIYTLNLSSGELHKLTDESFSQTPTFTPDGKHIIYMTGKDADIFPFEFQGADWWIMDTDGSNKKRLTFMNVKNNPQSVNHYRLAGSLSFLSNNKFLGGVMTSPGGLVGNTVTVEINQTILGISEKENKTIEFTLYPNPAKDLIQFNIQKSSENSEVFIYDFNGKLIEAINLIDKKSVELNPSLPNGIYFAKLMLGGKYENTFKFQVLR